MKAGPTILSISTALMLVPNLPGLGYLGLSAWELLAEGQKAPRVLGTAQSSEEFEAYQKILANTEPELVTQSAERFLQTFPDSGLSPYVHQAAAFAYQKLNDRNSEVRHGEAVLKDLPDNLLVLTILARAFAETDQPELSIARGKAALEALDRTLRPSEVDQSAWLVERASIETDVRLSLGTAYLILAVRNPPGKKDESLQNTFRNLQAALDSNPALGAASYRLGLAYLLQSDRDKAFKFLAWTVALKGPLGQTARAKLERLLSSEDSREHSVLDEWLRKGEEDLQKAMQAKPATRKPAP
jgi:tetratricopeptide (TPR) repeat protein